MGSATRRPFALCRGQAQAGQAGRGVQDRLLDRRVFANRFYDTELVNNASGRCLAVGLWSCNVSNPNAWQRWY